MTADDPAAYLKRAREHLARAEEKPEDADNVFVWSFWGLESTINAAAAHARIPSVKQHWAKGKAARKLAKDHGLPDVSGLLKRSERRPKGSRLRGHGGT